jgi:hypothetical protein
MKYTEFKDNKRVAQNNNNIFLPEDLSEYRPTHLETILNEILLELGFKEKDKEYLLSDNLKCNLNFFMDFVLISLYKNKYKCALYLMFDKEEITTIKIKWYDHVELLKEEELIDVYRDWVFTETLISKIRNLWEMK